MYPCARNHEKDSDSQIRYHVNKIPIQEALTILSCAQGNLKAGGWQTACFRKTVARTKILGMVLPPFPFRKHFSSVSLCSAKSLWLVSKCHLTLDVGVTPTLSLYRKHTRFPVGSVTPSDSVQASWSDLLLSIFSFALAFWCSKLREATHFLGPFSISFKKKLFYLPFNNFFLLFKKRKKDLESTKKISKK